MPASVPASPRPPAAFTVTSTSTAPIDAGAVPGILASCLGSDASQYHAVIAVRTPVASADIDGVVIAVNSANQYVQCESKGNKGKSRSVPATFINGRLWGAGHLVEFFDSLSAPAGAGQRLSLGAGHYTPEVAKVTISYGDDPTQYPTVMAGGAFVYTAAVSTSPDGNSFPRLPTSMPTTQTARRSTTRRHSPRPRTPASNFSGRSPRCCRGGRGGAGPEGRPATSSPGLGNGTGRGSAAREGAQRGEVDRGLGARALPG
ncbi:hypothetical protein ACFQ0M_04920 [Kitasatospora aburaviensis]